MSTWLYQYLRCFGFVFVFVSIFVYYYRFHSLSLSLCVCVCVSVSVGESSCSVNSQCWLYYNTLLLEGCQIVDRKWIKVRLCSLIGKLQSVSMVTSQMSPLFKACSGSVLWCCSQGNHIVVMPSRCVGSQIVTVAQEAVCPLATRRRVRL